MTCNMKCETCGYFTAKFDQEGGKATIGICRARPPVADQSDRPFEFPDGMLGFQSVYPVVLSTALSCGAYRTRLV